MPPSPWRRLNSRLRSRIPLLRLDWLVPSKALPHGLTGAVSLGSGLFLIFQAVSGAYAAVGGPIALGIYCSSTAANAVAGFRLARRAPRPTQSVFRISAVFQLCLVYHAFRFSPICPAGAVPPLLDAAAAFAMLGGIVAFVVAAFALVPLVIAVSILVGAFGLALLATYPVQLVLGGEEWWACVRAQYPQQSIGMSAYIYVPASWAFGAMMFGATLYIRKMLSDVGFGGGFTALVMLTLVVTVMAQEVHMPIVSTQKLWIPCPPPPAGSWSAWAETSFDFSALAQAQLRRFAPAFAVGSGKPVATVCAQTYNETWAKLPECSRHVAHIITGAVSSA